MGGHHLRIWNNGSLENLRVYIQVLKKLYYTLKNEWVWFPGMFLRKALGVAKVCGGICSGAGALGWCLLSLGHLVFSESSKVNQMLTHSSVDQGLRSRGKFRKCRGTSISFFFLRCGLACHVFLAAVEFLMSTSLSGMSLCPASDSSQAPDCRLVPLAQLVRECWLYLVLVLQGTSQVLTSDLFSFFLEKGRTNRFLP